MSIVVAIVCAHNEAPRIADVLNELVQVPELDQVLVMDDGSSDGTAAAAQAVQGVRVFRTNANQGKAAAMRAGVRRAVGSDAVFFCDADLQGLQATHVSGMIREYQRLHATQVVGLRAHGLGALSLAGAALTDIISGERVVSVAALKHVPAGCWQGYQIETGINHAVDKVGGLTVLYPLKGVGVVHKEAKSGVVAGFRKNVKMFAGIAATKRRLKGGTSRVTASDKALGTLQAVASAGHYLTWGGGLFR